MEDTNLPFKPGDHGEVRSFQIGFRGAWFRCKIKDISQRRGEIGHVSEYYDFPGEKVKWVKLYQLPYHLAKKKGEKHKLLVLRPSYPPIIKESEMPDASNISDVTVIVKDAWKVGDLVDWWYSGCFWSGKIIQLPGHDKAKIELHPPPIGEGSTYDGLLKHVRPSLDWSPEHGWTVPAQDSPPCARILKPMNEVMVDEVNTAPEKEAEEAIEGNISAEETNDAGKRASTESENGTCPLKSMIRSDPLSASVIDLVECLNKVKRLKATLQLGTASSDSSNKGRKWEYVHRGRPSTPK